MLLFAMGKDTRMLVRSAAVLIGGFGIAAIAIAPPVLADPIIIPTAGSESAAATMHVFAGAKEVRIINGYGRDLGIKNFELMIDWGWFWFITQPMFQLIDFIF